MSLGVEILNSWLRNTLFSPMYKVSEQSVAVPKMWVSHFHRPEYNIAWKIAKATIIVPIAFGMELQFDSDRSTSLFYTRMQMSLLFWNHHGKSRTTCWKLRAPTVRGLRKVGGQRVRDVIPSLPRPRPLRPQWLRPCVWWYHIDYWTGIQQIFAVLYL